MYEKAKEQYHPEEVSPFIYAHHVVCAIEAENGDIYTGFCIESCSGVMNICADRLAALNMYASLMRSRKVCFTVVPEHKLDWENWSTVYTSVILFGTAELITDPEEKQSAMYTFIF